MLWRRSLFIVAACVCAGAAHADTVSSLYFFGDSLTDEGRAGRTASTIWAEVLRNDLSITTGQNFAIGGATSGNQASAQFGNSGFLGQVNSFVTTTSPTGNAGAGVWIGTNDISGGSANHIAPATLAATTTQNVLTGVTELGSVGIKSVVLLGVYDLSLVNAGNYPIDVRDTAATASVLYNAQLASLAVSGVKIEYVSVANFIEHLQANALAYGFTQILPLQQGVACNASCQQTSIFTDTIHLTARAQALLGDYVASGNPIYNAAGFTYGAIEDNITSAAANAGTAVKLVRGAADQFTGSLFDRLDAIRDLPFHAAGPGGGHGSPNSWTIYAYGGAIGDRLVHDGNPGYETGLGQTQANATAGVEYRVSPELRVGAAFNYAHSDGTFGSVGLRSKIDSYQGALYASATYPNLFVDGVATGGSAALSEQRYGGFGSADAVPRGDTFVLAGRAGYLVPAGPIRLGPVGGLAYAHSRVEGYRETGDVLTAVGYSGALSDSLYGSAGAEFRLADPLAYAFAPFLTATYNRQFDRGSRGIATYLADLPTQSLSPGTVFAGLDYVKVAVGSTFAFGQHWYGTLTAFGLKGEQNLGAVGGNVGLAYRF